MKKVKIGFWIILIAFLLLLGYQNKSFFLQKNAFGLNLFITDAYMTPEIHNGVSFAVFFLAGLLIAYVSGLFERFRANKTIKQLNVDAGRQAQEIENLNTELKALKSASPPTMENPVSEEDGSSEAEATQVLS